MKKKKRIITNFDLGNNVFSAIAEIGKKAEDIVILFRLAENAKIVEEHRATWVGKRTELINKGIKRDENGEPEVSDGKFVFSDPKIEKDVIELDNTLTEISYVPIALSRFLLEEEEKKKRNSSKPSYDLSEFIPLTGWLIFDDLPVDGDSDDETNIENVVGNDE